MKWSTNRFRSLRQAASKYVVIDIEEVVKYRANKASVNRQRATKEAGLDKRRSQTEVQAGEKEQREPGAIRDEQDKVAQRSKQKLTN